MGYYFGHFWRSRYSYDLPTLFCGLSLLESQGQRVQIYCHSGLRQDIPCMVFFSFSSLIQKWHYVWILWKHHRHVQSLSYAAHRYSGSQSLVRPIAATANPRHVSYIKPEVSRRVHVPNIQGFWSQNHALHGFWDQNRQILGTWSLWVS